MQRMTRRNLAALALALPASAQQRTPAPSVPATPDEELKTARESLRANSEQLSKFELPIATEPATRFKA
jgi:hypothetical protein